MSSGQRPITEVAAGLGIDPRHLVAYGDDKAKVRLEALESARAAGRPQGKLILVSAVTPTDAGEGKTTTSIGLAQGLAQIGERVCLALREPSMGPVFGVKGGATGGGKAVLVPAEDINLHFTGDFHAITSAHNLLTSLLDNQFQQGNPLGLDPRRVLWKRVLDVNDRSLRKVIVGLGGTQDGVPRESGFDITAASEVMAILCLAETRDDLRARLTRVLVGLTFENKPVTAGDLGAVGAMMVVLKDALQPNLVQTIDGVPAFVHGGPFANIAHGCNSVLATRMALAHADWAVTEAGFAFDLGAEKFFDIKCRGAGLDTAAVVLVATVRALKRHGGVAKADLGKEDPAAVERGLANLEKHIESVRAFEETAIVALNKFHTDTAEEIAMVRGLCERLGVPFAEADHFARGGAGAVDLARTVMEHAEKVSKPFRPLYELADPVKTKLENIATRMYGARKVLYTAAAEKDLKTVERLGYSGLPLCVAKTQSSLSDNSSLINRPRDFDVTVRNVVIAAGAGYLVPLLGEMVRMPGLGASPQALRMDLVDGKVVGLLGG
ncbi:MAG: formate--tetrahydrofolate ligase [Acidobacteriota bacterium]